MPPSHDIEQTSAVAASEWCIKLMTDRLSHTDYIAFLAWCEESEDNRVALDEAIRAWQACDPISTAPAMIDLRSQALRDFRRAQAASHAIKWSRPQLFAALAAALVMAIGGMGAWWMTRSQTYSTAPAERKVVALDDGSRLSLDSDTVVRVHFEGAHRRLWIEKGRAKFDVAKDRTRPFTVTAGDDTVLATGTQFSVERLSRELRVVLYEGHVNVFRDDAGRPKPLRVGNLTAEVALLPGERLVSQSGSDSATIMPVTPEQSLAWESGELIFDNEPISTAVEQVNRYGTRKVTLGHLTDPALRVSGIYRAGDVDAFVDGVASVSGLAYNLNNGNYVLESRTRSGNSAR